MSKIDYSKWDNVGSSSDEESDTPSPPMPQQNHEKHCTVSATQSVTEMFMKNDSS